jgi:hypothetical protein
MGAKTAVKCLVQMLRGVYVGYNSKSFTAPLARVQTGGQDIAPSCNTFHAASLRVDLEQFKVFLDGEREADLMWNNLPDMVSVPKNTELQKAISSMPVSLNTVRKGAANLCAHDSCERTATHFHRDAENEDQLDFYCPEHKSLKPTAPIVGDSNINQVLTFTLALQGAPLEKAAAALLSLIKNTTIFDTTKYLINVVPVALHSDGTPIEISRSKEDALLDAGGFVHKLHIVVQYLSRTAKKKSSRPTAPLAGMLQVRTH